MPLNTLAIGLTTVPERFNLFISTLESLSLSGFYGQYTPRIFIDSKYSHGVCQNYIKLVPFEEVTYRTPRVGTVANWMLGLAELYARYPKARLYVMFQDDIILAKGIREYLQNVRLPEKGYFNLFTATKSVPREMREFNTTGWFKSTQVGYGAQAIVIPNKAVRKLLTSPLTINKPQLKGVGEYPTKNLDGLIVQVLSREDNEYPEYCHLPSLVEHKGEQSTLGHKIANAHSFIGEQFDTRSLLRSY